PPISGPGRRGLAHLRLGMPGDRPLCPFPAERFSHPTLPLGLASFDLAMDFGWSYGRCLSVYRNFYFDTVSGRCMTFIYSGCGGNANNFLHLLDCEAECINFDFYAPLSPPGLPLKCEQPKQTGLCKAMFPRYYYDVWDKKCTHFIYGGCGGNENNFISYLECYVACENPGKNEPLLMVIIDNKKNLQFLLNQVNAWVNNVSDRWHMEKGRCACLGRIM
uniref:BPTI/Kunitz inhibitor domain-containing protein n=1 Tax=Podarcis muralis TaxID=64176 RepID=A0A670KAA3_PODMU